MDKAVNAIAYASGWYHCSY